MSRDEPDRSSSPVHTTHGNGRHRVEASAILCGRDLVVALLGGERPHIGATAMAVPRPSLADAKQTSSSASVLCVTGHKEDALARDVALRLSAAHDCVVTVVAGLHIDSASGGDIKTLLENCDRAVEQLSCEMARAKRGEAGDHPK